MTDTSDRKFAPKIVRTPQPGADPARATGVNVLVDESGATLLFNKPLLHIDEEGKVHPQLVISAAVQMSWTMFEQMRTALEQVAVQRDEMVARMQGGAPVISPKPN